MSSIPQRKRARPKPPATGPGKNDNINNNSNNSNNKYNTHDSKYNTHDSNPATSPSGDSRNTDVTDEDVGVGSQVNSAQSSKVSYEESSAVEPSAKTSSKNSVRGGGGGECSEEDYSSPKPNGATGRGGPYDQSAPRKSGGLKKVSSQPVINHFSPSASASAASADENVTGRDGDLTLSKRQNKPFRPKTSKLTSRKDVSKSLNLDSSSPQNSNGAVKKQNGNSSSRSSSNGSSSGGSSNNNSNNNNNNVSRLSLPSDGPAASPRELSDGSEVGDKKVSFRDERLESYADDLPSEAPPASGDPNMAVHSDRQNALEPLQTERWENVNVHVHEPPNTERRDRQNALEPSPTERGSVTSRERVNSFGKKRDVSNASLDKLSAISREQPLVNRWTDSPRSGDASGPWRKVSNENSLIKSARETRDADLANEGAPPDRYGSPRDDFDFDPSGRKFTKKVGKHNFGSSTTLSSNTDNSEDNDDNFNVVLRVRPLNPQEKSRRDKFVADFPGDGQVVANNSGTTRSFQFNVVFEPDAAQEDVFENSGLKKLVENALNGYTCTAFAFGQTGSGKTHTMTGPPAQFHTEGVTPDPNMYGIIQRSFKHLFQLLKRQGTTKMIRASYLEIYNEQVIDLLNNSHRRYLQVRWSKNKGFYVENLFTVECESIDDLMAVLEEGLRNRQTGSHGLNEFSSRSHSVLTVTIDSETQPDTEDDNLYVTKRGKLSFVDLAGSEKVKDNSSPGAAGMVESNSINKSLLVLGNCISHLGDSKRRQGHIPYRDSKLTKLLADSLGGNGITLMIACITPASSNITETLNTLRYASRAKKIRTRPTVKMDPREKLIISLKKEVKILRSENHYLRQQLEFPAKPKGQLQKENDEKFQKFMKEQHQKETGLYDMLQEYMVENEALRAENSEMHSSKDSSRREQQILYKENEKLSRRVEELERLMSEHPSTWSLLDHHRRTDGYSQQDLSPRGSPVASAYHRNVRPTDLPVSSGRTKAGSPPNSHGQPMRPPHRLQDHVTRPAPRPVDYVEDSFHNNGYMSPRQVSLVKHGAASPRQIDRKASQISQTDVIKGMNEQLKKEVQQLEGEIQQHARMAHTGAQISKNYRR